MLGEAIIFFLHTYNNWPILDVLASFFVELLICVLKCNIKQWPNEIFVMFSFSMMCVCVCVCVVCLSQAISVEPSGIACPPLLGDPGFESPLPCVITIRYI